MILKMKKIFLRLLSLGLYPHKPIRHLFSVKSIFLSLLLIFALAQIGFSQSKTAVKTNLKASFLEDIWKTLLSVKYKYDKNAYIPVFEKKHKDLDNQIVTIKGYIYPLEEATKHSFFMLSYYPVNICFFCGGAGPESVVEVSAKQPINFTNKPIFLKGKLKLNAADPERLFYLLLDAEQVSQ